MKINKGKTIRIIIFFIALLLTFITRFYKLGAAPKGLYLDEAAQGYSAYSILKTGRDEFGKAFPIVFRSFTDFKTPVYIYLIVPVIPLFDLTSFAVRFPSFIFSLLTIPVLYLLIKRLTPSKISTQLALLSVLLLSVSPWHILFGRTNFECNVALFFMLSGVYFFYRAIDGEKISYLTCTILLAIAIPAYHSQRVIIPLILLFLLVRYYKRVLKNENIKYLTIGVTAAFFISLPTLLVAFTPGFLSRVSSLNIFSYSRQLPTWYIVDYLGPAGWFINNKFLLSLKEFLSLYFSYFSPRNMFVLGDYGPRSSFPELATFFIWQLPFYVYGIYLLFKKKDLGELKFFTLMLLLISPIPAALTRDPYITIRSIQLVIPQTIVIAIGLIGFYEMFKPRIRKLLACTLIIVFIYSLFKLYSSVIILNEYYRAQYWNYGWEETVNIVKSLPDDAPVIVDSARDIPYIQFLFFLKYDPRVYQQNNFEVEPRNYYTDMRTKSNWEIGNVKVRGINWREDLRIDQYLVGDALAISQDQINTHQLYLIDEVKYPDQTVAFRIVKTNPGYELSQNPDSK